MATNQQRREAAKRKLERQLVRRAERAKRRKVVGVGVTVGVVVLVAGLIVFFATQNGDNSAAAPNEPGSCAYPAGEPSAKPVNAPPEGKAPADGTVSVSVKTSAGDVPLVLDRAKAPCTVQSMVSLIEQKFYDQTSCHRLTTRDPLKVLQCGDPVGDGSGSPGYTIPDEPPVDLAPSPDGMGSVYPRGALAMAKGAAPNTGGSQFFIVYADSILPPEYTVFGTVSEEGLKVIDAVAAAGDDGSYDPSPGGGKPKTPVQITTATLT